MGLENNSEWEEKRKKENNEEKDNTKTIEEKEKREEDKKILDKDEDSKTTILACQVDTLTKLWCKRYSKKGRTGRNKLKKVDLEK